MEESHTTHSIKKIYVIFQQKNDEIKKHNLYFVEKKRIRNISNLIMDLMHLLKIQLRNWSKLNAKKRIKVLILH